MEFHKEITGEEDLIYSWRQSYHLFNRGVNHRKLSLMKQENIRVALQAVSSKHSHSLPLLRIALNQACGYCHRYTCSNCPIAKRAGESCTYLPEFNKMIDTHSRKEFARHHKSWCKKIGLWRKDWK